MPAELKGTKITMGFSNVTTVEPVRKKLAEATKYKVEIDPGQKMIKFSK